MLTLKHFFDRPTWAAVAGYNFNIIDCMSEAANRINISQAMWALLCEIPDIEVREIWKVPFNLIVCVIALFWVFIYPFAGLAMYFRCKRAVKKYPLRSEWPPIVEKNISGWLRKCERKFK